MFAIYMRELKSYFLTAIGYVYCGMFLVVSGLAFAQCTLLKQSTGSIGEYFVWMIIIFAVLIPLLTMKLIAEDRKTRTDQILLTSPVSVTGIVMGKYLAALTVYAATFLVNSFNFVLLIAAVSAMCVNAAMLLVSLLADNISGTALRTVVKWFSVLDRFAPFTHQMLDVSAIVYYLSLAAAFLFLTTRVIEKRRWS